ncbi:MAG TPA: adenylate cyclase regulatory domain-containing protein [Solirubrobacteraceae bacterium]|jgi:adenylate cyclase
MSVDFAAEGLLDGLEGEARVARERLLQRLYDVGVTLDELRAAAAEERLVLLPAERLIGGPPRYTGLQIAEKTGLEPEFLQALRRANGLPVPPPDAVAYTEGDLESAWTAKTFRDAGVKPDDMLAITRVLGRGLAQAAELMRAVTLDLVLEPGTPEDELALRYADAAARLEPLTAPMLGQMVNLHLRHVVSGEVLSAAEREAGRLPGARDVAIGFADLVGFTRMGEEVPPDELGRVADRLEAMAAERVVAPVRLVKTIGDAVMFASPEVPALVRASLDLVEAADAEGPDFPQLRAGLAYGPALSRAGDWYGRPVNLASRITTRARPGSVLVTSEVRDAAGEDGMSYSFAGDKRLKGVRDPVPLFRVRRADSTSEG